MADKDPYKDSDVLFECISLPIPIQLQILMSHVWGNMRSVAEVQLARAGKLLHYSYL